MGKQSGKGWADNVKAYTALWIEIAHAGICGSKRLVKAYTALWIEIGRCAHSGISVRVKAYTALWIEIFFVQIIPGGLEGQGLHSLVD